MTFRSPHIKIAHSYWKNHLAPGDFAIDTTCGNGHDTLALAQILFPHLQSHLLGMDIQQTAIDETNERLNKNFHLDSQQIQLIRACHSNLASIPLLKPPRLIVYNLGYLPGQDKSITTQTATTLKSLNAAIDLLAIDGALSITCYPGHFEGAREEMAILDWAQKLSKHKWLVCHHRWINRDSAPSFLWIQAIEGAPTTMNLPAL